MYFSAYMLNILALDRRSSGNTKTFSVKHLKPKELEYEYRR